MYFGQEDLVDYRGDQFGNVEPELEDTVLYYQIGEYRFAFSYRYGEFMNWAFGPSSFRPQKKDMIEMPVKEFGHKKNLFQYIFRGDFEKEKEE